MKQLPPGPRYRSEDTPVSINKLFIDSGAHSLYNEEAATDNKRADELSLAEKFKFFDLKKGTDFRNFLDGYAKFLKEYGKHIDYYVTLDAIYNPEKTFEITCFLENEYGLRPVPVVHCHAKLKWFDKYIDRGHTFIGIGGLGQGISRPVFKKWADGVFHYLSPSPAKLPVVRMHGFAMTSWSLLLEYPWWSVDSASWLKAGAFGQIYVPRKRGGEYVFSEPPYVVSVSGQSPNQKERGMHILNLTPDTRKTVTDWLDSLDIPLGEGGMVYDKEKDRDVYSMKSWGVVSHLEARARANLLYFHHFAKHLEYPRPFGRPVAHAGFGLIDPSSGGKVSSELKPDKLGGYTLPFYSGLSGAGTFPETLICEENPSVMLSYNDLKKNTDGATAWQRFKKARIT